MTQTSPLIPTSGDTHPVGGAAFATTPPPQTPLGKMGAGATVTPEAGSFAHLQRANNIEVAPSPEFVARIVNEGDRPFRMRYLTRWYTLAPGGQMIVPWEVMLAFMGNPYATNAPNRMDRQEWWKRLMFKYGCHDENQWPECKPTIRAYNATTGERYVTVIDDPDGSQVHPARVSIGDAEAMAAQMQALESQITMLRTMLQQNPLGGAVDATPAPNVVTSGFNPNAPLPPTQVFDAPPPGAVPLTAPATGAVEDAPGK